jgi:hypothetical protein
VKLLKIRQSIPAGLALAATVSLAACGAPPPPPPPPPPPVVVVPPQPQPPSGASANLSVPPLDAQGLRHTVNYGLSPAQTVWNLRSAYNVAALNCLQPQHAQIVVNYRAFLKTHAKKLAAVNKEVDQEFKAKFGAKFIPPRESYMTQVYNYFALPPTLPAFCDAALAMSNEAATIPSADLDAFAARSLPAIEQVFLRFYRSYEQYRTDLAAWQARYMASMPAPVAIVLPAQGAAAPPPRAQ